VTVASHAGGTRAKRAQPLDGPRSLQLSHEPDQGIERQHNRDCASFLPFSEIKRQSGSGAQQVDHCALELMQQHAEGGNRPMYHNRIWPISLEPVASLCVRQAGGDRNLEARQHLGARMRVVGLAPSVRCTVLHFGSVLLA
jgi:hypothetical protein